YLFIVPTILLAGFGACAGYWGEFSLDKPENRNLKNYVKLTVMACYRMFPIFCASFLVNYERQTILSVIFGGLFVPCYLLGIPLAKKISLPFLRGFTEWGEFLFWGAIYTALYLGVS
ncbi:MAG: hypothetical protein WCL30_04985, partial [Pseudomonadota bacterium]